VSDDVDRSISVAAERIETIIDAATRAASEIRGEAREEAERHLEEAEREADRLMMRRIGVMSQLTDSLIERAEKVRREVDELARAMEDAMRAVAGTMSEPRGAAEADSTAAVTGGASASGFEEAEPEPRVPGRVRETPAMRAARMAIGGSRREEIAAALTREYGIRDPDPILNEILGRDG
jgi:hypothetical protein